MIGMLACAETVLVVADALRRHKVKKTVIDPVRVSPVATVSFF